MWTRQDALRLQEVRKARPVQAAVHIATLVLKENQMSVQLGSSPKLAGTSEVVLVRLDASLDRMWSRSDRPQLIQQVNDALGRLQSMVERVAPNATWQLDYDCPNSKIADWAHVLQTLRQPLGPLHHKKLWVTSLVDNVLDPTYADRMQPAIDGHILQIFDMGRTLDERTRGRLLTALRVHPLPFALGLAAFQRKNTEEHAVTWQHLDDWTLIPTFRGYWIFPAGLSWLKIAEVLP